MNCHWERYFPEICEEPELEIRPELTFFFELFFLAEAEPG